MAVHIVQRGNNRASCFKQESDYLLYLANLRQLSLKFQCDVHAYCLMTNHVHLLLTPNFPGACTALMKALGQRYVQYFNATHGRTGTLWEGRFRSCLTQSAGYVLACYRYIELNPVRAKMVGHPSAYPWSSYAVNAGIRTDALLIPHTEFLALSADAAECHRVYRRLVDDGIEPSLLHAIRDATNGGYPLASEVFKSSLATAGRKLVRGRAGRRKSGSDPDFSQLGSDPDLFSEGGAS
ncbi:MAG TPA: transposase [Burkholderiales bacterium]|nr:transposase [Burkholderiales bacterium]